AVKTDLLKATAPTARRSEPPQPIIPHHDDPAPLEAAPLETAAEPATVGDDPLMHLLDGEMELPEEAGEALGTLLGERPPDPAASAAGAGVAAAGGGRGGVGDRGRFRRAGVDARRLLGRVPGAARRPHPRRAGAAQARRRRRAGARAQAALGAVAVARNGHL